MFKTPEQFAAANKATVDSLLSLANTAPASAERIAALNLNTARSVMEDSVSGAKALMGAKDVQEALSIQASLAQPNVEKAVAYSRSVYEISAQTPGRAVQDGRSPVRRIPEDRCRPAGQGCQVCPGWFRCRCRCRQERHRCGHSAFDNMNKAAKQVAEITEANVAAATNATVKAVSATTAASKK
jgi:phasin family protein